MDATLSQTTVTRRPGFWAAQFETNRTAAQDKFDTAFGLVLPILCLLADPLVFKSFPLLGTPLYGDYQLFAYVLCTVEMGFFLAWRTFPARVHTLSPLFAGVFVIGACFSFVVGVAMLPITLWMLIFLIGLLGLIPFVTAFVYLRNGVRAMKAQANDLPFASRLTVATLSGVLVLSSLIVGTVTVENSISASMDTLIYGNAVDAEAAANRLKQWPFIPLKHTSRLAAAYGGESDSEKRATFGRVYWELTGEGADAGLARLSN